MKSLSSPLFQSLPSRLTSNVSRFRCQVLQVFAAVGALVISSTAEAAGIEETVAGGVALGRAANYSRANDFMAILQNPANLAVIPGRDLGGELRLPIFHGCFDRARDNSIEYRAETFGNVCNSGAPFPTGNLGWVQSFDQGVGFGVGFFTPPGVAQSTWGKDTNVTLLTSEDEPSYTESGAGWPNRYMLLHRRALLGWLMAGIGWEPHPAIRFGASFGSGFFTITNKSVVSMQGGSFKDPEVINTIATQDWFVPRATASMVIQPSDGVELFGSLMYQGDVHATGHSDQVANGIKGAPRRDCYGDEPGPNCRVENVTLDVPFPTLEATFGFRYAARRKARERVLDPMKDEIWDIAVEGFWAQTSHVKDFKVNLYDADAPMEDRPFIQISADLDSTKFPIQQNVTLPHHWKDTFGARIGGDVNVIPEILSLRFGLSYSSNATRTPYMNIDAFPVQKVGLHAGLTLAHGRQKLTLAYAHLFYQTVTVPVGTGQVRDIAAVNTEASQAVNEGYYQAMLDVISIQGNISF